jgi:hypothetical protein
METEGSLPCSQKCATGPYPEPDESSPFCVTFDAELTPQKARELPLVGCTYL